jgi:hypothetical protein
MLELDNTRTTLRVLQGTVGWQPSRVPREPIPHLNLHEPPIEILAEIKDGVPECPGDNDQHDTQGDQRTT